MSIRGRRIWALILAVLLPFGAGALYLTLGNPAALNPANKPAQQPSITPEQLSSMVEKLEARLKTNPDDIKGWQMLARSYLFQGRYQEAAQTYAMLADKTPQDAEVYADWADALASAQNNSFVGEPEKLITKALQLDANNIKALAQMGSLAFERKDYKTAVSNWEHMASLVDPQGEMGQSVQVMLKEARARITTPSPEASAPALTVTGHLSIAQALQGKVAPEDSVFVFARATADGPPLAALRFQAKDLPLDFDFAQAQAMKGSVAQGNIRIGARISKHANPMAQPGDLEGYSKEVALDAQGINLEIDTEVK